MTHKVSNEDLREQIYRSKLSYTDLPRAEQRTLPRIDLYVDSVDDIPEDFVGYVESIDDSYLPEDFVAPFPPFQIWHNGDLVASAFMRDGEVSVHGRLTDKLGAMIYTLVTNYARSPQWAGYSYIDDMISYAIMGAMVPVLRYSERKTNNPFAFLTQNTYFSFLRYHQKEAGHNRRRKQMIEDAITEDFWSVWHSDNNEAANSPEALYEELCAQMDLLMQEELRRRELGIMTPRKQAHSGLKITPLFAQSIKYGLSVGLSPAAIAQHFGLDPATLTRIKNDIKRTKAKV